MINCLHSVWNGVLILVCVLTYVQSTSAQDTYFQQEVNYKIRVSLDDSLHVLSGDVEITYKNNAKESLNEIYIHLWANAHQDRNTALAEQKLRMGDTRMYFSDPNYYGGYTEINFTVNDEQVAAVYDKKNPDILRLVLNQPLAIGQTAILKSPFKLQIPGSFSRLGRVQESYQMTQWYPKPAVYDQNGWHPMPYLDQGEFYSEFGAFDVEITLPDNYVVAATGELQTESEKQFLLEKVAASQTALEETLPYKSNFPISSTTTKTIQYKAERVHDFAWFADKRFYVTKDEVQLTTGEKVDTWAFFTNREAKLWKKATDYLNRSVKFYSDHVGAYPYPQATAVQSALSAGAGMEYPMITVIGLSGDSISLDHVITHEVGHNWFYGILASNERDHPWMDEGLNSYYDHRYMQEYYGQFSSESLPEFIQKGSDATLFSEAYRDFAIKHIDQAPDTHSDEFSSINYGLGAYEKPAMVLRMLEHYLGVEKFDQAMKSYYSTWKFRHPSPQNFQASIEQNTKTSLAWVFDELFRSNGHMDYKVKSFSSEGSSTKLTIINEGEVMVPFPVTAYKNGEAIQTKWFQGFSGKNNVRFPGIEYDEFVIDGERVTLETNFKNNNIKTKGLLKRGDPLRLKLLLGLDAPRKENIFFTPWLGYNAYDGGMFGLAFYNNIIPARKFEYTIAPAFGLNSKDLAGLASFAYNIFPSKSSKIYKWSFGVDFRQFHFNDTDREGLPAFDLQYRKARPYLRVDFGKNPKSSFFHHLTLQAHLLWQEEANITRDPMSGEQQYLGNEWNDAQIYSLVYAGQNSKAINPWDFEFRLEQRSFTVGLNDESYVKTSFEWNSSYTYARNRNVNFRIFAGAFLQNDNRNTNSFSNAIAPGSFSLAHQAKNDYRFDHLYFGRTDQTGFWTQQVSLEDGGFKNITTARGSSIGQSNSFILALNMKADLPQDLPLNLPLKPYFDLGYFKKPSNAVDTEFTDDVVMFNGGVMLDLFGGIMGVYFPLFNSNDLEFTMKSLTDNYWQRVTFSIDIDRLNPRKLSHRLNRGIGL